MASAPVVLVAYDPEWPARFALEQGSLEQVLSPWLQGGVHHIGSTAIPGLAAKPIIDMLAGVNDLEAAQEATEALRDQGYVCAPHRAHEAHHFEKPAREPSDLRYGLHLTEPGSGLWRERLAFRDALRADPSLATRYEALKRRLAVEHSADVTSYTAGKREFVVGVLAPAGIQLRSRT